MFSSFLKNMQFLIKIEWISKKEKAKGLTQLSPQLNLSNKIVICKTKKKERKKERKKKEEKKKERQIMTILSF